MIDVILILEDDDTKMYHQFGSSADLEDFLQNEDLSKYSYKNILFRIDEEVCMKMSKIYKQRYFINT